MIISFLMELLFNILGTVVFIIIIILFFSFSIYQIQEKTEMNVRPFKTNNYESSIPEIFVDNRILLYNAKRLDNSYLVIPKHERVYEINGAIFREIESKDTETIVGFEIEEMEETEVIMEPEDIYFSYTTQISPYGIIVNSNIVIPVHNWNTLIDQDSMVKCVVCDCVTDNAAEHLETFFHIDNMQKYRPLKKFDLSITRLVNDKYHCGVCNECFDVSSNNDHFDCKSHENKMLFAINRASDVLYDFSIHNDKENINNEWHFSRNRIDSVNDDTSGFGSESADGFYDYVSENNEKDTWIPDNDSEESIASSGISYASIMKKSVAAPKYLYMTVNNKTVKVKFDSWHMIVTIKQTQIYCMACNVFDHVTRKLKHCTENQHLTKLRQCPFVESYKDYFIRRVDNRHYHCGICNNLQVKSDIDVHLKRVHAKKLKPALLEDPINRNKNNDNRIIVTEGVNNTSNNKEVTVTNVPINERQLNKNDNSRINEKETTVTTKPREMFEGKINNESPSVRNDVVIKQFNCQLRVSFISYNIVFKGKNDYYCCICNFCSNEEGMNVHIVNTKPHLDNLRQIPFQNFYRNNLIRFIGRSSHCTMCNMLLDSAFIDVHINEPKHKINLNKALTITLKQNVSIDFPNTAIDETNGKNTKSTKIIKDVKVDQKTTKKKKKVGGKKIDILDKNIDMQDTKNVLENEIQNNNQVQDQTNVIKEKTSVDMQDEKLISPEIRLSENDESKSGDIQNNDMEDDEFINESFVYLKVKNTCMKISVTSYNSLVHIGDGTRHCFVCSEQVISGFKRHVDSKKHAANMKICQFITNYDKHLLRQMLNIYHCAICNVMFPKSHLNRHVNWPKHLQDNKTDKKTRKKDMKSGINQVVVDCKKEAEYPDEKEPQIKIVYERDSKGISQSVENVQKKNKIVVHGERALKISWDHWHSLSKEKNGYMCVLCQRSIKSYVLNSHVSEKSHNSGLETFEMQYLPALIRKVNKTTLNCVICNIELSNQPHIVTEHIDGKKHKKKYTIMSDVASNYVDCKDDVLYL